MKAMTEEDFKRAVNNITVELMNHGYKIQKEPPIYSVELGKVLTVGVYCLIRFQLVHVPDISMFKVTLIRRRLENFPVEEVRYKPLYMDVLNLLLWFYKKDIFPPTQYAWKFTDEASLLKQITDAQSLVVEYGIPWLEDPMSNIEWVKNPGGQT